MAAALRGADSLPAFFRSFLERDCALTADRSGTARTFVWTEDSDTVVGYLSLCPHELRRDALPRRLAHGTPDSIPSILLARLALDVQLQGQRLGTQLLVDALTRSVAAS